MAKWCHEHGVEISAYCLMPNHTYPWSSACAHIRGRDDVLVKMSPMLALVNSWRELLCSALSEEGLRQFRAHGQNSKTIPRVHKPEKHRSVDQESGPSFNAIMAEPPPC